MENTPQNQLPLWQWIAIGLAAMGLLTAIYLIFFRNPITKSSTDSGANVSYDAPLPPGSDLLITIDSKGFTPKDVTVPAGIIVTWQNLTDKAVEIASNPHPRHTDNPILNVGTIQPGESKSLALPTIGTFEYHDHLRASRKGKITVKLPDL